eukprot:538017-Rhodomonas_salina.4
MQSRERESCGATCERVWHCAAWWAVSVVCAPGSGLCCAVLCESEGVWCLSSYCRAELCMARVLAMTRMMEMIMMPPLSSSPPSSYHHYHHHHQHHHHHHHHHHHYHHHQHREQQQPARKVDAAGWTRQVELSVVDFAEWRVADLVRRAGQGLRHIRYSLSIAAHRPRQPTASRPLCPASAQPEAVWSWFARSDVRETLVAVGHASHVSFSFSVLCAMCDPPAHMPSPASASAHAPEGHKPRPRHGVLAEQWRGSGLGSLCHREMLRERARRRARRRHRAGARGARGVQGAGARHGQRPRPPDPPRVLPPARGARLPRQHREQAGHG